MADDITYGEEEVAMYYCLGHAIQAWVFVEITLREIVLTCVNDDLTKKAMAVGFVSVEGFKAKLDFAEGIVGRKYVPRKPEWAELVKKVKGLSVKRNRLAHWGLALYEHNNPGRRYLLSPWKFEKKPRKTQPKRPVPPDGCLGLRDIVKYDIEFTHCALTLRNFAASLQGKPEPHAEGQKPPVDPPANRQLVTRIREVLANPLGSFVESPPA